MDSPARFSLLKAGEETRLTLETLFQVIPGAEIVATVSLSEGDIPALEVEPLVREGAENALGSVRDEVRARLASGGLSNSFSHFIAGVEWGILLENISEHDGGMVGALVIARHGRTWSQHERSLARGFAGLLSHVASLASRESVLLHQRSLDELVTRVAERLMSTSADTRSEVLTWVTQQLAEFLGADVAFLRRNDLVRGLSILEAEWPKRENIPDPDPLGEVRFDSDPIFMATRDLRQPYLTGLPDTTEEYLERINEASSSHVNELLVPVGGAAVPLLLADSTWGVLGFIHFELHAWVPAEINALQAVASMLVNLQARIDAEGRTAYNAMHDYLTGLPNRRALVQELTRRLDANRGTSVMVIDLDRFKVMNDYMGHASGDRLLVTIADRLRTSIRSEDFVARLGGDEFVFVVDGDLGEMEVLAAANRVLKIINESVVLGRQEYSHTASIGVAIAKRGERDSDALISNADAAMFAAKARGGNQALAFDEEIEAYVNERSSTEFLLREGVQGGQLVLYYQPELDLRTGELLAVEALVRWQHPTKGLLAASQFIKIAEDAGIIVDIGRWVFAEACRQLATWRHDYPDLRFVVRVNMSPADFVLEDIVQFVEDNLKMNDLPGEAICIEITEHVVFTESERTARILRQFRSLGVEIALDDFGTGFGSMTELKHLPVNFLKLDMSFVEGITTDPFDRAIVETILRLGEALNLGVIAEGIESTLILEELLQLGCMRGQGYLMSEPATPVDLVPLLRRGGVLLPRLWEEMSMNASGVIGEP